MGFAGVPGKPFRACGFGNPHSPLRRITPSQRPAGRGCSILAAHIRTIRMSVAYLAIMRQECRTSYKKNVMKCL